MRIYRLSIRNNFEALKQDESGEVKVVFDCAVQVELEGLMTGGHINASLNLNVVVHSFQMWSVLLSIGETTFWTSSVIWGLPSTIGWCNSFQWI